MQTIEIRIDRKKILDRVPPGRFSLWGAEYEPEDACSGADLVAQIDAAAASGARVILVSIHNCEGGSIDAGEAVYQALRRFSTEAPLRRVVVHVSGFAASTAAHIALAADYLLMDEDARFILHGSVVAGFATPEEAAEARRQIDARTREVALERSAIPPEAIDAALACQYDSTDERPFRCMIMDAHTAIEWRWADLTADLQRARDLSTLLARGDLFTPRTNLLRSRDADSPFRSPLPPHVRAECTIDAARINALDLSASNFKLSGRQVSAIGQNTAVLRVLLGGGGATPNVASPTFGILLVSRVQVTFNALTIWALSVAFTPSGSRAGSIITYGLESEISSFTANPDPYRAYMLAGGSDSSGFYNARLFGIWDPATAWWVDPTSTVLNGCKLNLSVCGGL